MNNKYYDSINKITTPPSLKEDVRQKLNREIRKQKIIKISWRVVAIAAVLAMAIGVYTWQSALDSLIMTDLVAGEHVEIVQLKDGELHFTTLGEDTRSPIRLAPPYPIRQNWTKEEYLERTSDAFLGLSFVNETETLLLERENIIAFFLEPPELGIDAIDVTPDAVLAQLVYQVVDSGGLVTIIFTNNSSLLYVPMETTGSLINDLQIGVGYREEDNTYFGVFEKDGYTVLISAENVEQELFIQLLYELITY